jgi:hypothetical protein
VKTPPTATAIAHAGHFDADRTNPGLHLALWQRAIPDNSVATLGIAAGGIWGEQHSNCCLYRLRQEPWRALA